MTAGHREALPTSRYGSIEVTLRQCERGCAIEQPGPHRGLHTHVIPQRGLDQLAALAERTAQ